MQMLSQSSGFTVRRVPGPRGNTVFFQSDLAFKPSKTPGVPTQTYAVEKYAIPCLFSGENELKERIQKILPRKSQ